MHTRSRFIEKILLKKTKMYPVLGLLGARQVGKSTFLMKQWAPKMAANYITFDEKEMTQRAIRSPAQFLIDESKNQSIPLIIDEAHKVPHIFDSIKAIVDKDRRNGAFTLSGSVEFSSKSGVRESLAGRMGTTKLYPMNLRELNNHSLITPWVSFDFEKINPIGAKSVETWLERGGIPIFCGLSDIDERIGLVNSWLEAICYKDIKQLKDAKYDSDLAYNLMVYLSSESMQSFTQLASEFNTTIASIKKHLNALETLFLIYKIPSFENPKAQPQYQIFDAGVLNALRRGHSTLVSRHRSLLILLMNEIYSQYEYSGKLKPDLYYYRTRGGSEIDLILKTRDHLVGIDCVTTDDISPYRQRGMKNFIEKHKNAVGYFVAPVQRFYSIQKNIHVIPWNQMG